MYVWVPEVGNTADTPNLHWVLPLLKEIGESPRVNENLTSVGFEPTTSGLDLPMLYRLSYEASTGAGRGNLGSESRLMYKLYTYIVRAVLPNSGTQTYI